ncbi:hypothetical protein SSS_00776 [Sarcoptes scabiei]|nr:hypothetical protein SSS_00776 [Sarcoptes scabiei]
MAMPRRDAVPLDCKVYVGELGNSGNRHELEDAFGYYGPLKEVWVARNPPGFAFVMFQDPRDARDAVRALDGKIICGRRVRVELSTGKSRHEKPRFRMRDGFGRGGFGGPRGPDSRRDPYGRGGMPERRYEDRYVRRGYSSRSPSPMARGRPRTPPSRSRSRSPIPKSPMSDRFGAY